MQTFTARETALISRLKSLPSQTILKIVEPCPLHSYCTPLPLFRVYRMDDDTFQAEWNDHHWKGQTQVFRFAEVLAESPA